MNFKKLRKDISGNSSGRNKHKRYTKNIEKHEEHHKKNTFKISEFWEFTLLIRFPSVT